MRPSRAHANLVLYAVGLDIADESYPASYRATNIILSRVARPLPLRHTRNHRYSVLRNLT